MNTGSLRSAKSCLTNTIPFTSTYGGNHCPHGPCSMRRTSVPRLEPADAALGCLLWRLELWRGSGQQNPLPRAHGMGTTGCGVKGCWCCSSLAPVARADLRGLWGGEGRPLKLCLLDCVLSPDNPSLGPTLSSPSFPSPGLDSLNLDLTSKGQALGILSFPPLLLSLKGREMLVCKGDLHPIPHLLQATLGSRAPSRACMPSHHSCFSKTKQK